MRRRASVKAVYGKGRGSELKSTSSISGCGHCPCFLCELFSGHERLGCVWWRVGTCGSSKAKEKGGEPRNLNEMRSRVDFSPLRFTWLHFALQVLAYVRLPSRGLRPSMLASRAVFLLLHAGHMHYLGACQCLFLGCVQPVYEHAGLTVLPALA